MKCKRIFNNNVILAEDEFLTEFILMGKGIGIKCPVKSKIDDSLIEKKFILDSQMISQKFQSFLMEIPFNFLELTDKVIKLAELELDYKFNNEIYIALADHITYAVKRSKQNKKIKNALLWEIKKLYPKEYAAALKALQLIRTHEKVSMEEDEAGFIALHFINGQQVENNIEKTLMTSNIINDIIKIIKENINVELDENSINYNRLITHLRYLSQRICNDQMDVNSDDFMFSQIKINYPYSLEIAYKVAKKLQSSYQTILSKGELAYLSIHIQRIIDRN